MDFQFPAGGHHCPPLPNLADGSHHRPQFSDPSCDGGHHLPLLPIPTDGGGGGGHHRPPPPNIAAAYFPASMRGTFQAYQIPPPPHTFSSIPTPRSAELPGDDAARKLKKSKIRAEILAGESDESRLLEEEVRRELYFERGMAERLREVERLGLFTPAPGKETPLREIERSIAASLRQLQSFGLMLPSPAVDFWPGNMPSHPVSHRPEARVGEMPPPDDKLQAGEREMPPPDDKPQVGERSPPDDKPQVGERSPPGANYHPIEAWVGERPPPDANYHHIDAGVGEWQPPDANCHSLDARVGEKRPPDDEIVETLPFPVNNLSDIGLALRPPGDSHIGEQHEPETVSKPKRDRFVKRKLVKTKIKKMPGQKAPATSGNCFQCGQPGHRRANCPASEEIANYNVSQQIDGNDTVEEDGAANNKNVSQQIDGNDMVEEDGAANDKCSRCGQSGHSSANCHASEEEAEWYKFTQEISDTDEVEVSEAHAPPANNNCFHCGEVGHLRANCPLSREAKRQKISHQMRRSNMVAERNPHALGASNLICHGCGKIGHMMRQCRFLKKQIQRGESAENMKHKVLVNGVDPAPGFGGRCFICGQSGHLRKQCLASRETIARFEDSYLKMKNDKKERKKERKKKKAGM